MPQSHSPLSAPDARIATKNGALAESGRAPIGVAAN
jgi:hypothetical protein